MVLIIAKIKLICIFGKSVLGPKISILKKSKHNNKLLTCEELRVAFINQFDFKDNRDSSLPISEEFIDFFVVFKLAIQISIKNCVKWY